MHVPAQPREREGGRQIERERERWGPLPMQLDKGEDEDEDASDSQHYNKSVNITAKDTLVIGRAYA